MCPHRRCPDVPNLAAFDDVVECLHDFFSGHFGIQTVNLKNIDVRAEPGDAGVDGVKDVFPGETFLQLIKSVKEEDWLG